MGEAFQPALDSAPFLLKGAYYKVILSLGGMFFGLVVGFGLALMRLSRLKLVSWIAR
ncbi:amino acid ABC transporter permease, partial [Pseudomonas fluorescens]